MLQNVDLFSITNLQDLCLSVYKQWTPRVYLRQSESQPGPDPSPGRGADWMEAVSQVDVSLVWAEWAVEVSEVFGSLFEQL